MKRFARMYFSLIPVRLACLLLAVAVLSWQMGYASVRGTRCMATKQRLENIPVESDIITRRVSEEFTSLFLAYASGYENLTPHYTE